MDSQNLKAGLLPVIDSARCTLPWLRLLQCGVMGMAIVGATIAPALANPLLKKWTFEPSNNFLEILVTEDIKPRYYLMARPARVVLDLPGTTLGTGKIRGEYPGAVRRIQVSEPEPGMTRLVLELAPDAVLAPEQAALRLLEGNLEPNQFRWALQPLIAGRLLPKVEPVGMTSTPSPNAAPAPESPAPESSAAATVAPPSSPPPSPQSALPPSPPPSSPPSPPLVSAVPPVPVGGRPVVPQVSLRAIAARPAAVASAPHSTLPVAVPVSVPVSSSSEPSLATATPVVPPRPPIVAAPPAVVAASVTAAPAPPMPVVTPIVTPVVTATALGTAPGVAAAPASAPAIASPGVAPTVPTAIPTATANAPVQASDGPAISVPALAAPAALTPTPPAVPIGPAAAPSPVIQPVSAPVIQVDTLAIGPASSALSFETPQAKSQPESPQLQTSVPLVTVPPLSPREPMPPAPLSLPPNAPMPGAASVMPLPASTSSADQPPNQPLIFRQPAPQAAAPQAAAPQAVAPPAAPSAFPSARPELQSLNPSMVPVIEFGQPLPQGLTPSGSTSFGGSSQSFGTPPASPSPSPNVLTAFSSIPGEVLLPAGTWLNLRYPGTTNINLRSAPSQQEVLLLQTEVRDARGQVLIPLDSLVVGHFETSSAGSRFVAQALSVRGRNVQLRAESEPMAGDRAIKNSNLAINSGIGALAGGVIGGDGGIIGGAAAGAAITYLTAPKPANVQPGQQLQVRLLEDLRS